MYDVGVILMIVDRNITNYEFPKKYLVPGGHKRAKMVKNEAEGGSKTEKSEIMIEIVSLTCLNVTNV